MPKYFYPSEILHFAFYRTPKALYTDPRYKGMDALAKQLYGLFLDRLELSMRNRWVDEQGRVYIIFTVNEVMEALGCANQKAARLFQELEKYGLIERKHQGLCKPNLIYLLDFARSDSVAVDKNVDNPLSCDAQDQESHVRRCENHTSGDVKTTGPESWKSHGNNTDNNNTERNDIDLINPQKTDRLREWAEYEAYFREALDIELLKEQYVGEKETLEGILSLIVDVCCSSQKEIRISGDYKPKEVVKAQFMKLNFTHIDYVLHCLNECPSKITNMKQYLLTTLYNAPITISPYYRSWVNNDRANGLI